MPTHQKTENSPAEHKIKKHAPDSRASPEISVKQRWVEAGLLLSILVGSLAMIWINAKGPGEVCNDGFSDESSICQYRHLCDEGICKPKCDTDSDCPDAIKCVTTKRQLLWTYMSARVCDLPTPLELEISSSIDQSLRPLREEMKINRKKLDVSQWLLIKLDFSQHALVYQHFDQYWEALKRDQQLKLEAHELGELLLSKLLSDTSLGQVKSQAEDHIEGHVKDRSPVHPPTESPAVHER